MPFCQYCGAEATVHIEPFAGAGYIQHLCEHHFTKGLDMARDADLEG